MPYSITTKDGITVDNIPDNVPQDAATLKERVAKIRQERGMTPTAPVAPTAPRMDAVEPPNWIEKQIAKLPSLPAGLESGIRGLVMGAADPSVGAAQLAANMVGQGEGINKGIQAKEQEYEAGRKGAGREGFDALRLVGNVASPANMMVASKLAPAANTVKSLAAAGAKMGAVGGVTAPVTDGGDNFLTDKAMQIAGGAAAGAVLSPVAGKVAEYGGRAIQRMIKPAAQPGTADVDVAVANALNSQGLKEVPDAIRNSMARQIKEAFDTGAKIDPASMIRKAEFEAVGLVDDAAPTLGQVTRDPMQFAKEKNLSGININGQNQLADRFQAQNQRLAGVFDEAGATAATDRGTAGQTLIQALRGADEPMKAGVDDLYGAARNMSGGRMADLDRAAFAEAANNAIDEGMLGSFIPANVRNLMNQIAEGKGPFNVDSAVQIDSLLSKAQRQAQNASDDAGAMAIGKVREALHSTPLAESSVINQSVPGVADEAAAARQAFDTARQAARSRFSTIENTPALKAAMDDVAPDKFVQKYVLNADARDIEAMRSVLKDNPDALAQARAQVADHLKKAAFGENPSGDKAFAADRYLKTLDALGKKKLELFFSPEEVVRLKTAGKVASDINSIPVGARYGTNTSGTAASAINAIMNILGKVPGGGVLGVPLNFMKNEVGDYTTQKAINEALSAAAKKPPEQLSPELLRMIQGASSAGGITGGAVTRE